MPDSPNNVSKFNAILVTLLVGISAWHLKKTVDLSEQIAILTTKVQYLEWTIKRNP
jgi:hypothetical protein